MAASTTAAAAAAAAAPGNLDALSVKFTHTNTVRDKKPYTIYEIEVRSSSTINWVIYKRYNDFYSLHQELEKLRKARNLAFSLPNLPPKRLTSSLAAEFVKKRSVELQDYVREILSNPILRQADVVLRFLQVPDNVRPMLSRANNEALGGDESKDPELAANQALLNSRSYQTGTEEEKRVLELVSLLANNSKNKVAAIKQFEEWFFETRPRLPQTAISCLLQGESGGPHDGGLLQTCGDVNSTHVSRHAALDLLCRLIDVERNKEAQNYVDELAKVDLRVIKRMQLHMHIASERGTRLGAFQIIAAIKSRLPGVLLEQYVADPRARAEFNQWAARKNESAAASAAEPAETVIRSVNMAEVAPRAISEEALTEVLAIATSEAQWIVVKRGDGDGQVKVMYRVDHRRSDLVVVRVMARLPCDVDTATKVLIDFGLRKEWDIMFHRGRRVESIDKTTDLVHFVFKSFSSPYKYRDFCLLRSWFKRDEIGGRVIVERSVIHPRVPEQKDHVRAVLFPSGYVITHMDEAPAPPSTPGAPTATQSGKKGCLLTWVAQMDRESVMIVSPELLGETDQLTQSVRNLMHLVASQPPSV